MSTAEGEAPRDEPAHDVLAAEMYAVPAADPVLHDAHEPAHDVLAAEMYAVPAPDPVLHHGPVRLPEDPAGASEPHDLLAAEEFPVPAPPPAHGAPAHAPSPVARRPSRRLAVAGAVAFGAVARALLRRR